MGYAAVIEPPLVKKFAVGCARHFVAGSVEVTTITANTLLLNYDPTGTQACDNIASLTLNGRTHAVYQK